MTKPLFKLVRESAKIQSGIDVTYLVWSIACCTSVHKYGEKAINWLATHLTNWVELDSSAALTNNLLTWIRKQPSHGMLAWLPTFKHLEWKDIRYVVRSSQDKDGKSHHLLSPAGCTLFFYQGIPFVLYKLEEDSNKKAMLECLWGKSGHVTSLSTEVRRDLKLENTDLTIT